MITINKICRYPVKGLSAEALSQTELSSEKGILNDRRFAIALGSTNVDQSAGVWMAKHFFLMLAHNPKLALLETHYDEDTQTLTILRRGKQVSRGKLTDPIGRAMIEDFIMAFMGEQARGRPKVYEALDGHVVSDQSRPLISLINLASVRDIERVTGGQIDPIRFRGNIYFDSKVPWQEASWIDQCLQIGDAMVKVIAPVGRCIATHVNPTTAEIDVNILKALKSGFSHTNCGVFAEVIKGATIQLGNGIKAPTVKETPPV